MSPASSRTFAKFLMAVTVASLITLTLPAQGRAAFGYTDIAYISSQYRLNGITLTALDWWEPNRRLLRVWPLRVHHHIREQSRGRRPVLQPSGPGIHGAAFGRV